jgi:hypothetical protein
MSDEIDRVYLDDAADAFKAIKSAGKIVSGLVVVDHAGNVTRVQFEQDSTRTAEDFLRDVQTMVNALGERGDMRIVMSQEAFDTLVKQTMPTVSIDHLATSDRVFSALAAERMIGEFGEELRKQTMRMPQEELVMREQSPQRLYIGGRQSGKTWANKRERIEQMKRDRKGKR